MLDRSPSKTATASRSVKTLRDPHSPGVQRAIKWVKLFQTQGHIETGTKEKIFLSDLHTHLMGNGGYHFWYDIIMGKVIPQLARGDPQWCDFLGDYEPSYADLDGVVTRLNSPNKSVEFEKAKKRALQKANEQRIVMFCDDVVYSVQNLYKGLCLTEDVIGSKDPHDKNIHMRDLVLARLLRPRQHLSSHDAEKLFQYFLVFNARDQRFEVRFGITNTEFLQAFSGANGAVIRNFFEMTPGHGPADGATKKKNFFHQFTPEFYPGRYAVKDDMYSQYPIILDVLLRYSLDRYKHAGVRYVEFSVGFGDLITRPVIFTHLSSPKTEPLNIGNYEVPPLPENVTFRYLAGFNRQQVVKCQLSKGRTARESAYEAMFILDTLSKPNTRTEHRHNRYFYKHFKMLDTLNTTFRDSRREIGGNIRRLHEMCVGLDYFGDEWLLPHCPFMHHQFIALLVQERQYRPNSDFGFRIHAGELNHFPPGLMHVHMGIVSYTIWKILQRYEQTMHDERPGDKPPPIRIGHGRGFYSYMDSEEYKTEPKEPTYANELQRMRSFIDLALNKMLIWRIPIEVTPTGDDFLQGKGQATPQTNQAGYFNPHFMKRCLLNGFRVIVATDNDGIWSTDLSVGKEMYNSVAAELLLGADGANASTALTVVQVDTLIENYRNSAFGIVESPKA